jgi:hypothetical protein
VNDIPRNNFNDYLQTGLLAANLSAQWNTMRAIHAHASAEASARELSRWEKIVRHRWPAITDPMDVEEAAERLMDFDQMETDAQNKRDMGLHLPQRKTFLSRIPGLIGIFFLGLFGYFILDQRTVNAIPGKQTVEESWELMQPWGWLLVLGVFVWMVWHASSAFVPHAPNYHPQDDSLICQMAYPGRKLRTKSGRQIVVDSRRTPRYEPRRLTFLVPTTDGLMYSSDDILWDDDAKHGINRSIGW